MAKLRIHTLWESSEDLDSSPDIPWLVAAADEYTLSDGDPSTYETAKAKKARRELIIEIDEDAVRTLFDPKVVKGTVVDGG